MPEIIPMTERDMDTLAHGLGSIAEKYGIIIQTCGTNRDYTRYGIHASGCITLEILGKANNCVQIRAQKRQMSHRFSKLIRVEKQNYVNLGAMTKSEIKMRLRQTLFR